MNLDQFDYHLPPELIAQQPLADRSQAKMLVLDHRDNSLRILPFPRIIDYLMPGDCLVVNDTRVIPARLLGRRADSGGRVEALLYEPTGRAGHWRALLRPGRRMRPSTRVLFGDPASAEMTVEKRYADRSFEVRFEPAEVLELLAKHGQVPLPPYIQRSPTAQDAANYQTVYATQPGAVAAPTAGLHFNQAIINQIKARQVTIARVTLHIGPGTFKPVQASRIEDHTMHEERYLLSPDQAAVINQTRDLGGRVIAVGTTTVRVLETCVDQAGKLQPAEGKTRLFMHPPMKPRVSHGLLTNFHLPRSTLLMLVATFCGLKPLLAAYQLAIENKMRFYSYGDCMLII